MTESEATTIEEESCRRFWDKSKNGSFNQMEKRAREERIGELYELREYADQFITWRGEASPEFHLLAEKMTLLLDYAGFDSLKDQETRNRYYFTDDQVFILPPGKPTPWGRALAKHLDSSDQRAFYRHHFSAPRLLLPIFVFNTYRKMAEIGLPKRLRWIGNNCLSYSPLGISSCFQACLDTCDRDPAQGADLVRFNHQHETLHVRKERFWLEKILEIGSFADYAANPRRLIGANSGLYELAASDTWFHLPSQIYLPNTSPIEHTRKIPKPYQPAEKPHPEATACSLLSLDYGTTYLSNEEAQKIENIFYPCESIMVNGTEIEIPYLCSQNFVAAMSHINHAYHFIRLGRTRNRVHETARNPGFTFLDYYLNQISQNPLADSYLFPPEFFPALFAVSREKEWEGEINHPLMKAGLAGEI
ncbi:MAG: hypothetical protein JW991_05080 [Candidatus Pacebacteria bacterium]|nr:hypothetical protein [Candidatus Paceibacterota bacterium]